MTKGTSSRRSTASRFLPSPAAVILGLLLCIMAAMVPETASATQIYRLGPQDRVRLTAFDWRSATDQLFGWTALNAEFTVDASGKVSLPLIGDVDAAGGTTLDLAERISQRMTTLLKLGTAPRIGVEVVEYRPFYISGAVERPGAYPYRPNLTILQAVAIAGGLPGARGVDAYSLRESVINARGTAEQLRLQLDALYARQARLKAEAAGDAEIVFPASLTQKTVDPSTRTAMEQETAVFIARRKALAVQVETQEQLKAFLGKEVESLTKRLGLRDEELESARAEYRGLVALLKKKLIPQQRQYNFDRLLSQLSTERLETETQLVRAQQELSRTELSITETQNRHHSEAAAELRTATSDIQQTESRYQTAVRIMRESEARGLAMIDATGSDDRDRLVPRYTIVHFDNGRASERKASEFTPLEPGDVLKVELLVPGADSTSVPTEAAAAPTR